MAEVDECAGRRHDPRRGRARCGRRRCPGTFLSARHPGNPVNHEDPDGAMHLIPPGVGTLKRELQPVVMTNVVGVQPSGCPRLKRRWLWVWIFALVGVLWSQA